jgi:diguanylate cyclase (GGDEF)-like protein
MLNEKIQKLEDLNRSYLHFVTNISHVVKKIDAKQKLEDIVFIFSHLVKNIVETNTVEFYVYDQANNLLKRIPMRVANGKCLPTCPMGRGLVGRAAADQVITTKEYFNRQQGDKEQRVSSDKNLWMAAPILFEKRLLGVIGIGEPKIADGANHLLRIIAEISGVALHNTLFLTEAKQKAETDPLTGLYNRRYFHQISRKFVEKAIAEQTPISVFLFDIDHFKHYNDSNGHEEGDKLLMELSQLVQEYTRKTSVVARYGGEEFIVLLPGISAADAFKYAERLREAVASHPFPHRETQPFEFLSISGGIAAFPDHERSIQGVIRLADEALYKAKESGRNRIEIYSSTLTSDKESGPHSLTNDSEVTLSDPDPSFRVIQ